LQYAVPPGYQRQQPIGLIDVISLRTPHELGTD
jgi:hypothetical protein